MESEEIYREWCAIYRAAWQGSGLAPVVGFKPADIPQHQLKIVLLEQLEPPFHMIAGLGDTIRVSGKDAAGLMEDMLTGDKLKNDAYQTIKNIEEICAVSGMSIIRWHICEVQNNGYKMSATITLEIMALNDSGTREPNEFLVGGGQGTFGIDKVKKLSSLQKIRQNIGSSPLLIDPILLKRFKTLPLPKLKALAAHLRKHPVVPKRGYGDPASWDQSNLERYNCILPDNVETVIVKKGVISGRVRFTEKATWNGNALTYYKSIPQTIVNGLIHSPLLKIVSHPDVDSRLVITRARINNQGTLKVTTNTILEQLIVPV